MEDHRKCAVYVCARHPFRTPDEQREWIRGFAERQGLDIVGIYSEEKPTTMIRPDFTAVGIHPEMDRMAEDAIAGRFDSILVEDFAVLSPSTPNDLMELAERLAETDVTLITRYREFSFAEDADVLCLYPDFVGSSRHLEEIWQTVVEYEARHDPPLWAVFSSNLTRRSSEE